ncbi:MAG: peroxiredoxin family protein [Myxococcota bacterium]|jgi:peroxiredoxin family protein
MTANPIPSPMTSATPTKRRRISLIVAHGGLDEVYPALILANAARMSDIEAMIFFTFYGLDAITEDKVDKLHVNLAGNPSSPMPTMVGGLPGMEALAARMMKKRMKKLDLPTVREMLEMLEEAGCELYACQLAMEMMEVDQEELIPQVRDVITAGDFYDLSEGAQIVFT